MAPLIAFGSAAGTSKVGGGIVKGTVEVNVSMSDGTTVELRGEIDLSSRTFIVVGHVEAAGEFSLEHDAILRKAFTCLAQTDFQESLIRTDAGLAGGSEH